MGIDLSEVAYGRIYKITNKVNNKSYIGQTINSIEHRWRQHLAEVRTRPKFPFHTAVLKYSENNFTIEELFVCANQEELNLKERYYTDYFNAWVGKMGYVCKAGFGRGSVSLETKQKMGNSQIGRKHSEESKKKISESHKGARNPNFGKPLSENAKAIMVSKITGLKRTSETRIRLSLAKMGNKNPNFNKKDSEETKKKKSLALMGNKNAKGSIK